MSQKSKFKNKSFRPQLSSDTSRSLAPRESRFSKAVLAVTAGAVFASSVTAHAQGLKCSDLFSKTRSSAKSETLEEIAQRELWLSRLRERKTRSDNLAERAAYRDVLRKKNGFELTAPEQKRWAEITILHSLLRTGDVTTAYKMFRQIFHDVEFAFVELNIESEIIRKTHADYRDRAPGMTYEKAMARIAEARAKRRAAIELFMDNIEEYIPLALTIDWVLRTHQAPPSPDAVVQAVERVLAGEDYKQITVNHLYRGEPSVATMPPSDGPSKPGAPGTGGPAKDATSGQKDVVSGGPRLAMGDGPSVDLSAQSDAVGTPGSGGVAPSPAQDAAAIVRDAQSLTNLFGRYGIDRDFIDLQRHAQAFLGQDMPFMGRPTFEQIMDYWTKMRRTDRVKVQRMERDIERLESMLQWRKFRIPQTVEAVQRVISRLPGGLPKIIAQTLFIPYDSMVRERHLTNIHRIMAMPAGDPSAPINSLEFETALSRLESFFKLNSVYKTSGDEYMVTFARFTDTTRTWSNLKETAMRKCNGSIEQCKKSSASRYARYLERMNLAEEKAQALGDLSMHERATADYRYDMALAIAVLGGFGYFAGQLDLNFENLRPFLEEVRQKSKNAVGLSNLDEKGSSNRGAEAGSAGSASGSGGESKAGSSGGSSDS